MVNEERSNSVLSSFLFQLYSKALIKVTMLELGEQCDVRMFEYGIDVRKLYKLKYFTVFHLKLLNDF